VRPIVGVRNRSVARQHTKSCLDQDSPVGRRELRQRCLRRAVLQELRSLRSEPPGRRTAGAFRRRLSDSPPNSPVPSGPHRHPACLVLDNDQRRNVRGILVGRLPDARAAARCGFRTDRRRPTAAATRRSSEHPHRCRPDASRCGPPTAPSSGRRRRRRTRRTPRARRSLRGSLPLGARHRRRPARTSGSPGRAASAGFRSPLRNSTRRPSRS
jgi:hypothetical protein